MSLSPQLPLLTANKVPELQNGIKDDLPYSLSFNPKFLHNPTGQCKVTGQFLQDFDQTSRLFIHRVVF